MIKKFVIPVAFIIFFLFEASAFDGNISAESAILIEQSTGNVLYGKNHTKQMKPASTTKILTALIALEKCDMKEIVTVSLNAANKEGSSMYIEEGEKLTVEGLLYGLMMNSGNDAATAIAEHISGNEEEFSKLMNQTAKRIGALNSNFVTPSGLDDENHYTTAYDLALITSYALENDSFKTMASTKTKVVTTEDGVKKYLSNHNKLLSLYEGCNGVKTGFTKASGRTLVSSAIRNDMQLVAVTFNAPDDWNDHMNMMNYGFSEFETVTPLKEDVVIAKASVSDGVESYLPLVPEKTVSYTAKKDDFFEYNVETDVDDIIAPVHKGQILGEAVITLKGREIERVKLKADKSIEKVLVKKSFFQIFKLFLKIFLKKNNFN